jgi:hypothetical protein
MNAVQIKDEYKQIIQEHYGLRRPLTNTELVAEVKRLARKWRDGSLDYRAEHLYFRLDLVGAFSAPRSIPR